MMHNPAGERNKGPILEVLKKYLPQDFRGKAMDLSAGIGVHVAYFASHFTNTEWLPTEFDVNCFNSIRAIVARHKLQNVLGPRRIDTREPAETWAEGTLEPSCFDFIVCINVIHISPWSVTEGLFAGSGRHLKSGGYLFTYGPYGENGVISPESNMRFDKMLKLQDPEWGIRDLSRVQTTAEDNGLSLLEKIDCPANNKVLVFQKA